MTHTLPATPPRFALGAQVSVSTAANHPDWINDWRHDTLYVYAVRLHPEGYVYDVLHSWPPHWGNHLSYPDGVTTDFPESVLSPGPASPPS
jgi:anthranilate/para-aminobenzoate synthase component II